MSHKYDDRQIEQRFKDVSSSTTFQRIVRTLKLGEKSVFDIGCGYGEYLAHFGPGSSGITTTTQEVEYAKRNGIDIAHCNAEQIDEFETDKKYDVIWANNFFEHILSPHAFLMKLKKVSRKNTLLILGVPVIPFPRILLKHFRFQGALATPHINFFTKTTLRLTMERAGWRVADIRSFYFKSKLLDRLTLPAMPHAYMIAYDIADYQYPEKKVIEWKDDPLYDEFLDITKQK